MKRWLDRWAPWVAAAVLLAGIGSYVGTRVVVGGGGSTPAATPAPLAAEARTVARAFVETAVARRDLARAWTLAGPKLRHGMTLADWRTGTIPVTPYPVAEATASYAVQSSTAGAAALRVTFRPKPGSTAQPASYALGLERVGARWLVASWTPLAVVRAPG